ncbi:hypothetical protein BTJ40_12280 [Microbulbifer sp. A4B17]|uniref:RidA family protein n=1 Tax=Microbulbifer sp. A4B17 TaxID=359370 RepID=UPI000D52F16D|nr:RidA family protein [Microbulbifer sp. A4B17]AWF81538.1 hypothetical protein BTJ40_12280 [Microbulbifer sp. A4B17]
MIWHSVLTLATDFLPLLPPPEIPIFGSSGAKIKRLAQGGFSAETKQTLDNIKQTLERYDYEMKDVVKCTVILTDIKSSPEFNNIYRKAFASPYPARTTFAVESLALDAQVEIECIAAK